jgi:phosphate transport system protein
MAEGESSARPDFWDGERLTLGRHFQRDMESLWGQILKLAGIVEAALKTSVRALIDGRADLAAEVRGSEKTVNRWEVQIELDCLKVLALHQPVASDLRRVAAVLHINGDLERMGDLASHIAKRSRKLAGDPSAAAIAPELEALAAGVLSQVRDSLDSLAKCDTTLARAVIHGDRQINRNRRAVVQQIKGSLRRSPERVDNWLRLINTARNLERVADHATNIAESVIYLKEGLILRHSGRRQTAPQPVEGVMGSDG